ALLSPRRAAALDDRESAAVPGVPAAVLPPAASGMAQPHLDAEEPVVRERSSASAARGSAPRAQLNCHASIALTVAAPGSAWPFGFTSALWQARLIRGKRFPTSRHCGGRQRRR